MSKIYLVIALFFLTSVLFAQESECECIEELNQVSKLIENSKSYKIQIKKAKREAEFNAWKTQIAQDIRRDSLSRYFCAGYLQKYISFITDRHNQIYKLPKNLVSSIPVYAKTIDTVPNFTNDISGIYYAGADKILVTQENDSLWYGITIKSNAKDWTRGMIRLRIHKTSEDSYEIFEFYENGLLFYQKDIEIKNGRLHSTFWNKNNTYFFNKNHQENFSYTTIADTFDYIGIKTLARTKTLMNEADVFYDTHLKQLTKEHLIIDLRNNGGGAIKQAEPLLKAIHHNKSLKSIVVMINFLTASAAESVVLELMNDPRTVVVGEHSRGMLAYGYGNKSASMTTDCAGYKLVLSTTYTNSKMSKYESVGIAPAYELNNTSDWIEQIQNLKKIKE